MYFGIMNYFDLAIVILISIGIFRGFIKGLINEIFSLISLYLGIIGSINYSNILASYIISYTKWNETTTNIICFLILFILIVFFVTAIAKLITKILKLAALGLLNRIIGSIFGGLKWLIILSGLALIYNSLSQIITIAPNKLLAESFSYNILLNIGHLIFD